MVHIRKDPNANSFRSHAKDRRTRRRGPGQTHRRTDRRHINRQTIPTNNAVPQIADAHELRHEPVRRAVVYLPRCSHLSHSSLAHHADPVRHGQRLLLVVRDLNERRAKPLLQSHQFGGGLGAQAAIQRGQRLIQQQPRASATRCC